MGWFSSKPKEKPAPAKALNPDDFDESYVGWVTYNQDALEKVARTYRWQPQEEQPSSAIPARVLRDPKTPRDPDGFRVQIGKHIIGYMSRTNTLQSNCTGYVILEYSGGNIVAKILTPRTV
jgi:hypothetical protein